MCDNCICMFGKIALESRKYFFCVTQRISARRDRASPATCRSHLPPAQRDASVIGVAASRNSSSAADVREGGASLTSLARSPLDCVRSGFARSELAHVFPRTFLFLDRVNCHLQPVALTLLFFHTNQPTPLHSCSSKTVLC